MIHINLIPEEIHAAILRKQVQTGGIAAGSLVVLCLVGFWGTRLRKIKALEAELFQANQDLSKYQTIVDKVNELEQTRNQLKARRDVIQQLLRGRLTYPRFFEDFMSLLPSEIWVNSFNTSLDAQGTMAVNITAQSLSNFAIADWLSNLQGSPLCSSVVLGSINSADAPDGKSTILTFSLSFRYARKEA